MKKRGNSFQNVGNCWPIAIVEFSYVESCSQTESFLQHCYENGAIKHEDIVENHGKCNEISSKNKFKGVSRSYCDSGIRLSTSSHAKYHRIPEKRDLEFTAGLLTGTFQKWQKMLAFHVHVPHCE